MRVVQNKGSAKGAARTLARTKIDVNGSPTAQFLNVENHGCLASRQYGIFSPTPPEKFTNAHYSETSHFILDFQGVLDQINLAMGLSQPAKSLNSK